MITLPSGLTIINNTPQAKRWFVDTETCGFVGPCVLIQYAIEDGPINLYDLWHEEIGKTKDLIRTMMEGHFVGFNVTFDSYQIQKIYNMLDMFDDDEYPIDIIDDIGMKEAWARDGKCLKPAGVTDLMLLARKGHLQTTMNRKPIRIRKIPTILAERLSIELNNRMKFDDILFARRKRKLENPWQVFDTDDPAFKDICLRFLPSGGLKAIAEYVGISGEAKPIHADRAMVDKKFRPVEYGYAPFATAVGNSTNWRGAWPEVIEHHIDHWLYSKIARQYAEDDIRWTRGLWEHFQKPEGNDDDSILSWQVGVCRWKGFKLDKDRLLTLRDRVEVESALAPKDPKRVLHYLLPHLSELEKDALTDDHGKVTTKKEILEAVAKWENHPAADAAKEVLKARKAATRLNLIDKLLKAGRLHADFSIIGAKSGRMSGAGSLNAQGIPHEKEFRKAFPMAFDEQGFQLSGGDFDAFEVTLLDAKYPDPVLHAELLSGVKIHVLMAEVFYPHLTREEIIASKDCDPDYYGKGKEGTFAISYLVQPATLAERLGISEQKAEEDINSIRGRFCEMSRGQMETIKKFTAIRQEGGIGSAITWHDPQEYAETLFGFQRDFSLEVRIMRELFELAQAPPASWRQLKMKVVRRDRTQTASGAVQSALFGASFGVQGQVVRAANNHGIQGSGAEVTKKTQASLWGLQPIGINDWRVIPINIHDEVMCPNTCPDECAEVVAYVVELYRPKVPLIEIGWQKSMPDWSGKT